MRQRALQKEIEAWKREAAQAAREPDARVLARESHLRKELAQAHREVRVWPPPSLPYKVDTSRPSLRTNWTRCTTGPPTRNPIPQAAECTAG